MTAARSYVVWWKGKVVDGELRRRPSFDTNPKKWGCTMGSLCLPWFEFGPIFLNPDPTPGMVPSDQFELFQTGNGLFYKPSLRNALEKHRSERPNLEGHKRLEQWQKVLENPKLRADLSEPSDKAEFLGDIFGRLLGYKTIGEGDVYHLRRERPGPADNRPADGLLGYFGDVEEDRVRAVIEVKQPDTDLDARSQRADRLSPVDQGFLYAKEFEDVGWVIVTDFEEIRLYNRKRGTTAYASYQLGALRGDALQEFHFLFRREHLVGDGEGQPLTERLAEESWRAQSEITERFYEEYHDARIELYRELRNQNPGENPLDVLRATQTLLDRLLFILFCSDRGLLPHNTLKKIREKSSPSDFTYGPETTWTAFKRLFDAVNEGHPDSGITGYNGGLFKRSLVDELEIRHEFSDEPFVLHRLLRWDDFDFESQIDVDVLGHIFEHSISDLERLRSEIAEDPAAVERGWRRDEGIFYTPEWVTQFIVRQTVERFLDENPDRGPGMRVLDPACGSGAFLIQLIPIIEERIRDLAPEAAEELEQARESDGPHLDLFRNPDILGPEILYDVLQRTVYGVDKNSESVEITKLSFWLKTVVRGHALPRLDENIRVGNSLCDDEDASTETFSWEEEFSFLEDAGFDVIVGNPPWGADVSEYEGYLREEYETVGREVESAYCFVERSLRLLADGGYLGFILPDSILDKEDAAPLRRLLVKQNTLHQVIKLGEGVFPGVYRSSAILVVQKGPPPQEHTFQGLIVTKADRRAITDVATTAVDLGVLVSQASNTIRQARIEDNANFEFDVFVGEEDEALMDKIEDRPIDFSEVANRGRGIELNREGHIIQCPSCMTWNPPPATERNEEGEKVYKTKTCEHCGFDFEKDDAVTEEYIISDSLNPSSQDERMYLDGESVNRYRLEPAGTIDTSYSGLQYKDKEQYQSPKIVFREAGVGITATIDYDLDAYLPKSVYVLRLKEDREEDYEGYRLEYLLGVLNSRVMLYYYFKKYGQIEWQSFPRWTLSRLTSLPIRHIDWSDPDEVRLHGEIADAVEELIRGGASGDPTEDLHIEKLVMELYGLTGEERTRIWQTLKQVQELKIIREVLPRQQTEAEVAA